ncbi:MAG TPA: HD domain-containing phosphohydrolase [Candidatus Polarisedimenticolaceae bacterium]|nr:HD domain-containing phosphohydrolase [Candidatus Polarisedimenticolaceae bacterium]
MIEGSVPARKRLLVVDDELSVREILCEGLTEFGFDTATAADAAEALKILADRPIDLVLTDIEMPGASGMTLLAEVKRRTPDLDVIMVTGVVDTRTAIGAIREGASDYLTKPFNLDEVQIVVERTLEKRRLIEQNRAYQEHLEDLVEERTEQLRYSYESTLQALVTALDFRDNETQGHSARVVEYAVLVARQMGIGEPELTTIRWGSILHDVGKIGIPDRVLLKPGTLSEEEWVTMKRHPEMGYRMLQHIAFLGPALDIVFSHQERYDGTGYPRGLRAEEIPLGARVFAVVDTFDAMTSDRPYRQGLSIEAARAEIERCSGTQFDPRVAHAFLSIAADRWREIRTRVHEETMAIEERVRRVMGSDSRDDSVQGAAGSGSLPSPS